jgi:hypothetical protein
MYRLLVPQHGGRRLVRTRIDHGEQGEKKNEGHPHMENKVNKKI